MIVVWIFQIALTLSKISVENNSIYSHLIFVSVIILWVCFRYPIKDFWRKCPPAVMVCCPFIAIVILALLIILGAYIYVPNLFEKELNFAIQDIVLCTITFGLMQPIAEELLFRGVLLHNLLKWKDDNPWLAIIVSSVLFSIVHLNYTQMINAAILGLIMGWLFYKTKSLWPCLIIHVTNNLMCCILSEKSFSFVADALVEEYLLVIPVCIVVLYYLVRKLNVILN